MLIVSFVCGAVHPGSITRIVLSSRDHSRIVHRNNEDGTTLVALGVGVLTSEQEDEEFEDEEFEVGLELLEVDELELDSLQEEVGRRGCRTFRL